MDQQGYAGEMTSTRDFDAVIVGASLAGATTAMMLGRAGARVALVEQRPDDAAYKKICSHYIQSSAVPTLERTGLLDEMEAAGAVRSRARIWAKWGWIEPPADSTVPSGVNLRRERLDPLVRRRAAETPGVELMLGHTLTELVRGDGRIRGVHVRRTDGATLALHAPLVVGADGRGSHVAKLAGVPTKTVPHGRFAYGGYFEGPAPMHAPDASFWLLNPHMAAAFPTDEGLTFYAVMPTKKLLDEFRTDPARALVDFIAAIPDAPPIRSSRIIAPVQGKLDMTNVAHQVSAPGLALVGDAALAIDPLWGVGCGWAFQSAEWLAENVAGALTGPERSREAALEKGLRRYRHRHRRGLGGHAAAMYDYSRGRRFNYGERMMFSAAALGDERLGQTFEAFGTRNIGPLRALATGLPRALVVHARARLGRRPGTVTGAVPAGGA